MDDAPLYDLRDGEERSITVVLYEVGMLNEAYLFLYSGVAHLAQKNIAIESFLIHARQLMDFLSARKGRGDDDVVCTDFLNSEGKPIERVMFPDSKAFRDLVGKHLAHVTRRRTVQFVDWRIPFIRQQLNSAAAKFLHQCADSYFNPGEKEGYERQLKEYMSV